MIGSTISHYKVIKKIGEGDTGVVYECADLDDGDTVALKIIKTELTGDETVRASFAENATAAAELGEPGINAALDIGTMKEGDTYIVSRYASHRSLRERLQERPLTMQESINIISRTAEVLQAAHASGILHLDIKPSNILIGRDDEVRIGDFGAASLGAEPSLESLAYVSPEQLQGRELDERSDIYSLGVVFFEMLAGYRPFEGDDRAALTRAILEDEPPHLSQYGTFPDEVHAVIGKLLARNPVQRPPTMGHLLAMLEQLQSRPGGAALAGAKRRSRWARNGFFGTRVVLIAVVGYYAITRRPSGEGERVAEMARDVDFAVAVMPFWGETSESLREGKAVQTLVSQELGGLLEGEREAAVIGAGEHRIPRSHDEARSAGERLNASVVIWGEVEMIGGTPDITVEVTLLRVTTPDAHPTLGRLQAVDRYTLPHCNHNTAKSIAYVTAGDYFQRRGATDRASTCYRQARDIHPANPWPEHSKGWEFALHGRISDALESFRRAAEIDPKQPLAHTRIAAMYTRQGMYEEAVAEYHAAAQLDPQSPSPHVEIGAIYYLQGEFDSAAVYFDGASARTGAPVDYRFFEFVAYNRAGRADEAQRELGELTRDVGRETFESMLARYYAGELRDEQLLAAAELDGPERAGTYKCEAHYHIGMAHLMNISGDPEPTPADTTSAVEHFRACVSTQMTDRYEYRFANMELNRLARY